MPPPRLPCDTTRLVSRSESRMKSDAHTTVRRKDYRPPAFGVEHIEMGIDLDPSATRVAARLHLARTGQGALTLDGEGLELLHLAIDGRVLKADEYRLSTKGSRQTLSIAAVPDRC